MRRRLIVMRHAKSSWEFPKLSDHDRPLNKRGLRDAPRMGNLLKEINYIPDLILVSSSKRALQTLEGIGKFFKHIPNKIKSEIYHASIQDLLSVLKEFPSQKTIMIIGHNPSLEILINHLSGEFHIMPTASIALLVEGQKKWSVKDVLRPKEI